MTPPASQMQFHLDQRLRWFRNEWLCKWHQIGSDSTVLIDTFDGRQAGFGGIEYSGSATQVFWDSITRGVRKEITEQFAWLDEQVRRYNSATAERAFDECAGLLVSFAESVRRDATEKDRVLRGRHGTPAETGEDSGQWHGTTRAEIASRAKELKEAFRPDATSARAPTSPFDHAEKQVLAALVIDYHRPADRLLSHEEFEADYLISTSAQWVDAILDDLGERGFVDVHRDKEGSAAILRPASLKRALQQVMEDLGATSFEVDPKKERVFADAEPYPDFPLPKGWEFLTFAKEPSRGSQTAGVVTKSESWTGRPARGSVLSETQRVQVVRALSEAERRLDELELDNSRRAQVLAYINAAKELAESPDPPAELIWEILNRANHLAGIGSFFVSLLALFVAAT